MEVQFSKLKQPIILQKLNKPSLGGKRGVNRDDMRGNVLNLLATDDKEIFYNFGIIYGLFSVNMKKFISNTTIPY